MLLSKVNSGIIAGGGWVTQEKRVKWRARMFLCGAAVCAPFSALALHFIWETPLFAYGLAEWSCWGLFALQAALVLLTVAAFLWEKPIIERRASRDPEFDLGKLYLAPRRPKGDASNAD